MELLDHYLQLFNQLNPTETGAITVTRSQLAETLYCSERNVVHIIKNLQGKHWISWESGSGRGHASSISFRKSKIEVIIEESTKWLSEGNYSKLFSYANKYLTSLQKQELFNNLPDFFGYKEHIRNMEKKDVLTFPYFRKLYTLNPTEIERQSERHIVSQLFDTLVECNNGQILPKIAHYWIHDESFTNWTFFLRKGILFHNGHELTANDVKFTFDRLKNTSASWITSHIEKIMIPTPYTIQFSFSKSSPYWLDLLSSPKCSIVPNGFGGKTVNDFDNMPIGTGPFKVKIRNEEALTLSAHSSYFLGRAHLDEIVMIFLPNIHEYLSMLSQKNQIGYFPFLLNQTPEDSFNHLSRKHLSIKYLMWNMGKAPDINRRILLKQVINKEKLIQSLKGNREAATDAVSEIYYTNKAKEISPLRSPIKLKVLTYDLVPNVEDLKWLQAELIEKNIHLDLQVVPYDEFINGDFPYVDLYYSEYVIDESHVASLLNLFNSPTSMVNKSISCLDIDKVKLVENELLESGILLPLYTTSQQAFFHESLRGTSLSNVGLASFKDLFFIENKETSFR